MPLDFGTLWSFLSIFTRNTNRKSLSSIVTRSILYTIRSDIRNGCCFCWLLSRWRNWLPIPPIEKHWNKSKRRKIKISKNKKGRRFEVFGVKCSEDVYMCGFVLAWQWYDGIVVCTRSSVQDEWFGSQSPDTQTYSNNPCWVIDM